MKTRLDSTVDSLFEREPVVLLVAIKGHISFWSPFLVTHLTAHQLKYMCPMMIDDQIMLVKIQLCQHNGSSQIV